MTNKGKIEENKAIQKFLKFVENTDVKLLEVVPVLIGFSILLIWSVIGKDIFPTQYSTIFPFVLIISAIIFSFSGVFLIIKREARWFFGKTIRGIYPIFSGIIWIIFCFIMVGIIIKSIIEGN